MYQKYASSHVKILTCLSPLRTHGSELLIQTRSSEEDDARWMQLVFHSLFFPKSRVRKTPLSLRTVLCSGAGSQRWKHCCSGEAAAAAAAAAWCRSATDWNAVSAARTGNITICHHHHQQQQQHGNTSPTLHHHGLQVCDRVEVMEHLYLMFSLWSFFFFCGFSVCSKWKLFQDVLNRRE